MSRNKSKTNDDTVNAWQEYPSIAINETGNFVIVWEDKRRDPGNVDVFGQRFFANGDPIGKNFRVVSHDLNLYASEPVAAVNMAKIVFSWMDDLDIYGKIVDWDWIGVVPVELLSFKAGIEGNGVKLSWTTASETNNRGFEIERKTNNSKWSVIGFRDGMGTTTSLQEYNFIDNLFDINETKYSYRLKQIDFHGTFKYSKITEIELIPVNFSLSQNYPNPFNPSTKIKYTVPCAEVQCIVPVQLKVYDVLGNEVAILVDGPEPAGNYEVEFDAKNLPIGVYFYTLSARDYHSSRKMLLLK